MSTENTSDNNTKNKAGQYCCESMEEMMKKCASGKADQTACCAMMQQMMNRFCSPAADDTVTKEGPRCCG